MRARMAALALLAFLAGGCAPLDRAMDARAVERGVNEVASMLDQRRPKEAAERAYRLLAKHPDSVDAALGCGALFAQAGDHPQAMGFYRTAWRIHPQPEIAQVMAMLIWQPGKQLSPLQIDAVRRIYRDGLEKWPDNSMLLNDYAYFLADLDIDIPQALEMARRAVALAPTNAMILDTLAWALHRSGDDRQAYDLLSRALVLDGSSGELRSHMAQVCRALGMTDRAGVEELKARLLGEPVPLPPKERTPNHPRPHEA